MQNILIVLVLSTFQKKLKKFIVNKNMTNIHRIQVYNSIMCGFFCVGFIDFLYSADFTHLFPPNSFEKSDEIIL